MTPTLKTAAAGLIGSVMAFAVLFGAAVRAYPGGTHFDHAAPGHDFWRNTLCDVARTIALDGTPNRAGCAYARAAMTILALGLGVLLMTLPRFFPSRRREGATVRALGTFAVVGAIAVVFLPTDQVGALHGIAIVIAGIPGLTAALVAVHALIRERAPRTVTGFGVATLLVAATDFVLYGAELASRGNAQVGVSALERIATIFLLGWMIASARAFLVHMRCADCAEHCTLCREVSRLATGP
jgi:hypothetical protein